MKIPTQKIQICVGIFLQHYTFLQKRTFSILCENFSRFVRKATPAKVIIASIMGSNEEEWTKLASLCEKAGADGLAAINTIKSIMNVDLKGFSTSPNVSG